MTLNDLRLTALRVAAGIEAMNAADNHDRDTTAFREQIKRDLAALAQVYESLKA